MILVADIFHISNGTSYLTGIKRVNFNFDFPSYFDLYVDGNVVERLRVEGLVLANNSNIDEYFEKITFWVYGHVQKSLIHEKKDVCLKYCQQIVVEDSGQKK